MSVTLHRFIENHNLLEGPTREIDLCFVRYPSFYKTALIVNHLFRTLSMIGLMKILPFSTPINTLFCFVGSLFYRLTVETNCAYKFALPAFAGSIAAVWARKGAFDLISGIAFTSLLTFCKTAISLVPWGAYVTYIALTIEYDVNARSRS